MAVDIGKRQLDLIGKLAALEPALWFMGGHAEDAILAGRVTRPHEDIDLIFPGISRSCGWPSWPS
jgi:Aminoglycoside-2''-adenylyltransferase